MRLEIVKIHRLAEGNLVKAFVDVLFDDVILVRGIKLLDGKRGAFVGMPTVMTGKDKWIERLSIKDKGVYENLSTLVINKFNEKF